MLKKLRRKIGRCLPKNLKNFLNKGYGTIQDLSEDRRLRKLYGKIVKPGDLVFDIGANLGNHSQIFLDLGAKVVLVEPLPEIVQKLNEKFSRNKNAIIVSKGVASKKSRMKLNLCDNSKQHSTFLDVRKTPLIKSDKFTKTLEIETITLKELISKYGTPKLLKIDTEGFEYEALKTLETRPEHIFFEFTFSIKDIYEKCIKKLEDLGYKKFNIFPNIAHTPIHKKMLDGKQLRQQLDKLSNEVLFGDIYARN